MKGAADPKYLTCSVLGRDEVKVSSRPLKSCERFINQPITQDNYGTTASQIIILMPGLQQTGFFGVSFEIDIN